MSKQIEPLWMRGLAFCPVCQENLSTEDIDFECCSTCGGEGFPEGDDDDYDFDAWRFGEPQ